MNINYTEINNIVSLVIKEKLRSEQFIKENNFCLNTLKNTIINYLKEAKEKKDAETLDGIIYLIFYFNLKSNIILDILNELLIETWHFKHEDLVTLIDEYCSEKSVAFLKKACTMKLSYLTYEEDITFALASKCIWALGNIGNEYAIESLVQLSKNTNKIISFKAQKQLERLKL